MIIAEKLSFRYAKNSPLILNNISFRLEKGKILGILGKNGVGKTTLLRCLSGELENYSGSVRIDGKELKDYSILEKSKIMAVVASNNECYQNLKVADFLVTGFANQLASLSMPGKDQYEKAYTVLKNMGKEAIFNAAVFALSSGEMQIVKIARAILQNPKVIVFDEPTSNLDVGNQLMVLNQITKLSQAGYTVITTTHNPGQVLELEGDVMLMLDGAYVYGRCRDVVTAKNLSWMYGLNVEFEAGQRRDYAVCEDKDKLHRLVY